MRSQEWGTAPAEGPAGEGSARLQEGIPRFARLAMFFRNVQKMRCSLCVAFLSLALVPGLGAG